MMGSNYLPATLLRGKEQMHEVRIGNTEQCIDAFGFEQLQNAFIDFYGHDQISFAGRIALNEQAAVPPIFRLINFEAHTAPEAGALHSRMQGVSVPLPARNQKDTLAAGRPCFSRRLWRPW